MSPGARVSFSLVSLLVASLAASDAASLPALSTALEGAQGQVAQEPDPGLEKLTAEVFRLLNESRAEAGLERLQLDPTLSLLAYRHSQEQANRGRVSHHSYEFGLSTERRVHIAFPALPRLAENVARNRTVARLHAALLASEGHRRNRMDAGFTHVGIGLARKGDQALYLTEIFVTSDAPGPLGEPVAYYYDAPFGSYEQRDNPLVEQGPQTIIVGAPGPDDPEYWTNVGIDAYNSGDLLQAETSFRKALELKADYHYAQYNLARVLISNEAVEEAAQLLDELIERDPDDIDAIATRGTAALFLEDYASAAEFFRRVLRVRSEDANNWYNFALSLEYLDRPRDAEVAYQKALDLDPYLTAAAVGLGRVRRR